jgi:hypothetical protein
MAVSSLEKDHFMVMPYRMKSPAPRPLSCGIAQSSCPEL